MSHFTVMVIGKDVEKQLAPFHEFECTGENDEFIQDIDTTEESRAEFEEATITQYKLADGRIVDEYGDELYREPTEEENKKFNHSTGSGFSGGVKWTSKDWGDGKGRRAKIYEVPADAEKIESKYESFRAYLDRYGDLEVVQEGDELDLEDTHKFGYAVADDDGNIIKTVRRTNPNAKWDWYVVGGRWSGLLLKHDGTRADNLLKSDIDVATMRNTAAEKAGAEYDLVFEIIGSMDGFRPFDEFAEEAKAANPTGDWGDAARKAYHAQPQNAAMNENRERTKHLGWFINLEDFTVTREQFQQAARDNALCTFAVLKDGTWYQKGQMGWWGAVSNEDSEWSKKFAELFDGLADDEQVTIVDCHI